MNPNLAKSYKSSAVLNASPGQLILMLYDGALKFLAIAEHGLTLDNPRERIETVNNNLIKAQNILAELQSSLDMKVEGEFPKTMFRLYDFMIRQLQQANIKKEAAPIKVVAGMLKDVRDAWEEMLRKNIAATAAAAPAVPVAADPGSKVGGGLNASA
jgi:flagellar secretion chaperone FliS